MQQVDGQQEIERVVIELIGTIKRDREIAGDTPLFGNGLGMDSLETAELSALLEDQFGRDPYAEGEVPSTVAEIVAFYVA